MQLFSELLKPLDWALALSLSRFKPIIRSKRRVNFFDWTVWGYSWCPLFGLLVSLWRFVKFKLSAFLHRRHWTNTLPVFSGVHAKDDSLLSHSLTHYDLFFPVDNWFLVNQVIFNCFSSGLLLLSELSFKGISWLFYFILLLDWLLWMRQRYFGPFDCAQRLAGKKGCFALSTDFHRDFLSALKVMIVAVLQILRQKSWLNSVPALVQFRGDVRRDVLPIPRSLVLVWLEFLRNVPAVNGESLGRSLGGSMRLVWGFFDSNRKTDFFQLIFRGCDDIIILFNITVHLFILNAYLCCFSRAYPIPIPIINALYHHKIVLLWAQSSYPHNLIDLCQILSYKCLI